MEIKIIINESGRGSRRFGKGRGMRNWGEGRECEPRRMGEGRLGRHGRPVEMSIEGPRAEGRRRHAWGEGREGGHRLEEKVGGRVIGQLIETPDGRVRLVRRGQGTGEMGHRCETGGRRRHGRGWHRQHMIESDRSRRHDAFPASDDDREARRARRTLARSIVRALEESGYGEIRQA